MPLNNPVIVNIPAPTPITASTATPTSVTTSGTSSTVLTANANRRGASFWNFGSSAVFVDVVNTVSTTAFAFRVDPGGHFEVDTPTYTGAWFAICSTGQVSTLLVRDFLP